MECEPVTLRQHSFIGLDRRREAGQCDHRRAKESNEDQGCE